MQNHYPFHQKAMVADYVYPVLQVMKAEYQEYVLRIKEYIGLLTIRGRGALWS